VNLGKIKEGKVKKVKNLSENGGNLIEKQVEMEEGH